MRKPPARDNSTQINILFICSWLLGGARQGKESAADVTSSRAKGEVFSRDDRARAVSDAAQKRTNCLADVDRSAPGNSPGDNGAKINEVRNDRAKSLDSTTLRSRELGEFITGKGTCREIAPGESGFRYRRFVQRGDTRFARHHPLLLSRRPFLLARFTIVPPLPI